MTTALKFDDSLGDVVSFSTNWTFTSPGLVALRLSDDAVQFSDVISRRERNMVEYNRIYRGMFAERDDDFGHFARPKQCPW